MRFVAYLETTGGPVCLAPAVDAPDWNGVDGDYWALIAARPPERPRLFSTSLASSGTRFAFFWTETGNWSLFATGDRLRLVEIVWAPQDFRIEDFSFDLEHLVARRLGPHLAGFGGRTVLFDSTLDGSTLTFGPPGSRQCAPGPPMPNLPPDTAVLDLRRGLWSVSSFDLEDPSRELRLQGVDLRCEPSHE